jgi:hypothetical protein
MGPRVILGLVLLVAAASLASAASPGDFLLRLPSSAPRQLAPRSPSSDAVDLIRALNLHPTDASSRLVAGPGDAAGPLVERPLRLASMAAGGGVDPSVEGLGHRAGYYRLPNTHDAR